MALVIARKESLTIEVRACGEHALVIVAGEVDLSTVGGLYDQFAALSHEGVRHVCLNLAEVTYMDSTGLSVVVAEHKRVESMGGELIIFSPRAMVRRLFDVTGLNGYLNVRPMSAAGSLGRDRVNRAPEVDLDTRGTEPKPTF
jgi:stage II sporulation protein AA (anti-sigma F factor antagonist)